LKLRRSRNLDQRFHVIEVLLQCAASGYGQRILRARDAASEGFFAGEVAGILEFAGVDAYVAIRSLEDCFQFIERQRRIDGERGDRGVAGLVVNEAVGAGICVSTTPRFLR
jgi:hypothetical protein